MKSGSPPSRVLSFQMRLALVVSAWVLYTLAFAPAFSVVGDAAATLVTLPMLATAWLFGLRGGFGAALLNVPLTTVLFNLAGQSGWEIMIRRWPGIVAGLMIGVITGWLSDRMTELARVNAGLQADVADRRQTEAVLEERARMAAFSAEVGQVLILEEALPEGLRRCAEAMVRYLGAAFARIWILNPATDVLELQASAGMYTHLNGAHSLLPLGGDSKVAIVGREKKPHLTNAILDDPNIQDKDWIKREGMVAFAGYPLIVGDRLVGVMAMFARQPLTDITLAALASVSNTVALGVARRQTEAALKREQKLFEHGPVVVVSWLAEENWPVTYISPNVTEQWGYQSEDFTSGRLLYANLIHPDDLDRVALEVNANNVSDAPSFSQVYRIVRADGEVRWVGDFTLVTRDETGTHYDGYVFDITARRQMEESLAHYNAEVAEILAREQRLNEVARLISGTLELSTVLSTVVRLAAELIGAEAGAMALVTGDGQMITFPFIFNLPETLTLQSLPKGQGLAWQIVESGEPVLMTDYRMHPQATPGWVAAGVHAFIGVPVVTGEACLGALGLFYLNPDRRFIRRELALVELVGRQAGVAIQNARLFEANRRRVAALTALHETGLALSAQLDLPALLRTITERAARLLEAPMGGFYLLLPDEQILELVVSYNNDRDYTGLRLRLGEGLSGKVAQTGEPMIIDDYHEWEGRASIYEQAPFRAVLALPIKWQGKVLGVITTNDNRPNRFGPADLELVSLFADQAAVAIVNARLFESLEHREEYFRALIENASEGITVLDRNGTIRYQSPFIERVLGYKPEDFMGQHALAPHLLHPDDLSVIAAFGSILQTPDATETVEVRIRHKNGRWRNIEVTGHNLLDNPVVAGVVLNYRDITERKLAEEQLRKLSRAVEQSPASVVITDTAGNIEYVNPRFTQITGYTFEEVIGKNPRLLKSGETPLEVYKQLWNTITGGGEWRGEFHNKKKSGELYWELSSISPILDASGAISHFLAVKEDITGRKQTEAALAAANAELERALLNARELAVAAQAANRAKSEFLTNVSHEIRTPLTAVLGYTELTLNTDLNEEQRESLQQVHTAGEILLELLNNILDLSRIEAARLDLEQVNFDLPALLQQAMSALASRATTKGLRFSHSLSPDTPAGIVGDPTRLRQVLLNLLDNAIKYTERGEVTLEVWLERASAESALLHFAVRDTGIGIPEEKLGLIFEPFTQADGDISRKYGGTGLGLAISKKLVEKFSGELWVESKVGQGSAFHFFAVFGLPTR